MLTHRDKVKVHSSWLDGCVESGNAGFLLDGSPYDPEKDYYMIDFYSEKGKYVAHYTNAFSDLTFLFHITREHRIGEEIIDNVKVLPEKWLSQPKKKWDKNLSCYVPDFITNRQNVFSGHEEQTAVMLTGEQTLSLMSDETPEEWFIRLKKDPRTAEKFEAGYHDYSELSWVDGKWTREKN